MGDVVILWKSDEWYCKLILYMGDIENVNILILKVIVCFCKVGKNMGDNVVSPINKLLRWFMGFTTKKWLWTIQITLNQYSRETWRCFHLFTSSCTVLLRNTQILPQSWLGYAYLVLYRRLALHFSQRHFFFRRVRPPRVYCIYV